MSLENLQKIINDFLKSNNIPATKTGIDDFINSFKNQLT